MFMAKWKLLVLAICCVSGTLSQNACEKQRLDDVKSGKKLAQGVNLGSWFVIESYITPYIFEDNGCDRSRDGQYLLEKCLGSNASSVLQKHWSTLITEADFEEMSSHGINVVRIPLGWWQIYDPVGGAENATLNYDVTPRDYLTGSLDYVDKAFDWGLKHGIAVIVDMHAATGSQNGQPYSSPTNPGEQDWDKYPENIGQTIDSMELFAKRYANHEALFGFAVLNEPNEVDIDILHDYYKRVYEAIRKHSDTWVIISPLINPFQYGTESNWTSFMNPDQNYTKVAMDMHYYSCVGGPPDQTTADGCIDYIKTGRTAQISEYLTANPKPLFIGEWNGCYHATEGEARVAEFINTQVEVYNTATVGWTYWTWATTTNDKTLSLKSVFNEGWLGNLTTPC